MLLDSFQLRRRLKTEHTCLQEMGIDDQEAQVSAVKPMFPARLSPCIKSMLWKHPPADRYQLASRGERKCCLQQSTTRHRSYLRFRNTSQCWNFGLNSWYVPPVGCACPQTLLVHSLTVIYDKSQQKKISLNWVCIELPISFAKSETILWVITMSRMNFYFHSSFINTIQLDSNVWKKNNLEII